MTQDRTPPVEELLARGGWALVDPRPTAAAHPDTFEMPTADELAAVRPGHQVRAMYAVADLADEVRDGLPPYGPGGEVNLVVEVERMWSTVLEVGEASMRCRLGNQPLSSHGRLALGAVHDLPLTHLIATDTRWSNDLDELLDLPGSALTPEQLAAPVGPGHRPSASIHPDQQAVCDAQGLRPHRPWMFSRCLVAKDLAAGADPVHGGRFPPVPDRGDNGWVVWAGYPDLDTAQREAGFDVVPLQEVHARRPEAWRYLALPPGWGFTHGTLGSDVYPIDVID